MVEDEKVTASLGGPAQCLRLRVPLNPPVSDADHVLSLTRSDSEVWALRQLRCLLELCLSVNCILPASFIYICAHAQILGPPMWILLKSFELCILGKRAWRTSASLVFEFHGFRLHTTVERLSSRFWEAASAALRHQNGPRATRHQCQCHAPTE